MWPDLRVGTLTLTFYGLFSALFLIHLKIVKCAGVGRWFSANCRPAVGVKAQVRVLTQSADPIL